MSPNSKKPFKPQPATQTPLDRPFEPAALSKAEKLAAEYRLVLTQEGDSFVAHVTEFPGLVVRGSTPNVCEQKAREGMTILIASMLEVGRRPPTPITERRSQLNCRLAPEERVLIETAAKKAGFRGVSDYVRSVALAAARVQLGLTD